MSKIYRGDTPCPQCGKSGIENLRYTKDQICHECKQVYEVGEKTLKTQNFLKDELVFVAYRDCYHYFDKYRSQQSDSINNAVMNLLKTLEIHTDTRMLEKYPETIRIGCDGLSCAWINVLIYKTQWQAIEDMIKGIAMYVENYIGDINELERKAFEAGQDLLLNLNSDRSFAQKANEYAVKK